MPKITRTILSLHTISEIESLIMDIESYPQFLPWCADAKILKHHAEKVTAELYIDFKVIKERYTSEISLHSKGRSRIIDIKAITGPFKHFTTKWILKPVKKEVSITIEMDFAFNSFLKEQIFKPFITIISNTMIEAFKKRAAEKF